MKQILKHVVLIIVGFFVTINVVFSTGPTKEGILCRENPNYSFFCPQYLCYEQNFASFNSPHKNCGFHLNILKFLNLPKDFSVNTVVNNLFFMLLPYEYSYSIIVLIIGGISIFILILGGLLFWIRKKRL